MCKLGIGVNLLEWLSKQFKALGTRSASQLVTVHDRQLEEGLYREHQADSAAAFYKAKNRMGYPYKIVEDSDENCHTSKDSWNVKFYIKKTTKMLHKRHDPEETPILCSTPNMNSNIHTKSKVTKTPKPGPSATPRMIDQTPVSMDISEAHSGSPPFTSPIKANDQQDAARPPSSWQTVSSPVESHASPDVDSRASESTVRPIQRHGLILTSAMPVSMIHGASQVNMDRTSGVSTPTPARSPRKAPVLESAWSPDSHSDDSSTDGEPSTWSPKHTPNQSRDTSWGTTIADNQSKAEDENDGAGLSNLTEAEFAETVQNAGAVVRSANWAVARMNSDVIEPASSSDLKTVNSLLLRNPDDMRAPEVVEDGFSAFEEVLKGSRENSVRARELLAEFNHDKSNAKSDALTFQHNSATRRRLEALQPAENIWRRPFLQHKPRDAGLRSMYGEDSVNESFSHVHDLGTPTKAEAKRADVSTPLNSKKDNDSVTTPSDLPSEDDENSDIDESLGDQFADFIALVGLMPRERRPRNFSELRFLWRWAHHKHLNNSGKWHVQENESTDESVRHGGETVRSVPVEDPFNVMEPQPIMPNFLKE